MPARPAAAAGSRGSASAAFAPFVLSARSPQPADGGLRVLAGGKGIVVPDHRGVETEGGLNRV